jgi:hypothetical protein
MPPNPQSRDAVLGGVADHKKLHGIAFGAHLPHLREGFFAKVGRVQVYATREQYPIQFEQYGRQPVE